MFGWHHRQRHLSLQKNTEWFDILVIAYQAVMDYWQLDNGGMDTVAISRLGISRIVSILQSV